MSCVSGASLWSAHGLESLSGDSHRRVQYLCSLDWLSLPSNWRRNSSFCRVHRLCVKGMALTRQICQSNLDIQQECCSQITRIHRNLLILKSCTDNPVGLWKKHFRIHSYIGHLGEEGTSARLFPVCGFLLYVKGGKSVLSRASLKLHSSVPEAWMSSPEKTLFRPP